MENTDDVGHPAAATAREVDQSGRRGFRSRLARAEDARREAAADIILSSLMQLNTGLRQKPALPWPEFQGTLRVLEAMKAPAKAVASAAGQ